MVVRGLDALLDLDKHTSLYRALSVVGAARVVQPLDAFLAAIAALLTVIGRHRGRFWGRLLIAVTALYMLTSFAAAQASLLSLLVERRLGMVVGIAVRYLAGEVNERPDALRIAPSSATAGSTSSGWCALARVDDEHREYHGLDAGRAAAHDRRCSTATWSPTARSTASIASSGCGPSSPARRCSRSNGWPSGARCSPTR